MKRMARRTIGAKSHRHGWPRVVESILQSGLLDNAGVNFHDFADSAFLYAVIGIPPRPWIGIFHHPVDTHPVLSSRDEGVRPYAFHPISIYGEQERFRSASKHLKLAVVLGTVQKRWFESKGIDAVLIPHPIPSTPVVFDFESWRGKGGVVQIGHYLRNSCAIGQITETYGRPLKMILPESAWKWHGAVTMWWNKKWIHHPEITNRVENDVYDEQFRSQVVITDPFLGVANNVILDCIASATPVLTRRSEASEEYLGRDYPGFFAPPESTGGVIDTSDLLREETVLDMHRVLLKRRSDMLSVSGFVENLRLALRSRALV